MDRGQWTWAVVALGTAVAVFLLLMLFGSDDASSPDPYGIADENGFTPEDLMSADGNPETTPPEEEPPKATPVVDEPTERPPMEEPEPVVPVRTDPPEDDPKKTPAPSPAKGPSIVPGAGAGNPKTLYTFADGWGMAWAEADVGQIGTRKEPILTEALRLKEKGPVNLILEWPRHQVEVGPYGIDRYEVTNAQFRRFLNEDAYIEYTTQIGDFRVNVEAPPLVRLAHLLVTRRIPEGDGWIDPDGPGWMTVTRQLYETNKRELWDTYPGLIQKDDNEVVDEERTWIAFLEKDIRSGIEIWFYDCPPPSHWPTAAYEPQTDTHPVRGISYEDAAAFAYWAGKHLPTELEWEYAARGPGGLEYPWSDDGDDFHEIVNGGKPFEEDEVPLTMPVNTRPEGASWMGCWHMVGNVAEFTGSTPYTYDTWEQIPDPTYNPWAAPIGMGEDPVVKGGSVADSNVLHLRPAFRGWRRPPPTDELMHFREKDEIPPPLYELRPKKKHRLEWTGFRCARYAEAGRSRLRSLLEELEARQWVPLNKLDVDAYAGMELLHWVDEADRPSDGTYVLHGTRSVLVVPMKQLIPLQAGNAFGDLPGMNGIESADKLVGLATDHVNIILAMVQLDVHVTNAYAGNTSDPASKPTRFSQVELPPGTYILALRHGYVALVSPDGQNAWYISDKPIQKGNVHIFVQRAEGVPFRPADFRVNERGGILEFELFNEVWREEEKRVHIARIRFHVETLKDELDGADDWARHPEQK